MICDDYTIDGMYAIKINFTFSLCVQYFYKKYNVLGESKKGDGLICKDVALKIKVKK